MNLNPLKAHALTHRASSSEQFYVFLNLITSCQRAKQTQRVQVQGEAFGPGISRRGGKVPDSLVCSVASTVPGHTRKTGEKSLFTAHDEAEEPKTTCFPRGFQTVPFTFPTCVHPQSLGVARKVCVSAAGGVTESVGGQSPAGCKACNLSGGLVWDNHRTGHGMEINVE